MVNSWLCCWVTYVVDATADVAASCFCCCCSLLALLDRLHPLQNTKENRLSLLSAAAAAVVAATYSNKQSMMMWSSRF